MSHQKKQLPYDRNSREPIHHYSIDLRGSTLRKKTDADEISDIRRNKGSFGSAVETHYFMLGLNNESEADFKEAGLELKTTPLKRNKDDRYRRLVPDELDQLQGFPKGWTADGMSDGHRAFCMGNALVVGIPHLIGKELARRM